MKRLMWLLGIILMIGLVSAIGFQDCTVYGNCRPITTTSNVNYSVVNVNNSQYLQGYNPQGVANLFVETDPICVAGYIPYIGATQNINLGNNDFIINGSTLFVNSTSKVIGMGTNTPSTNTRLDISGSQRLTGGLGWITGVSGAGTVNNILTNNGWGAYIDTSVSSGLVFAEKTSSSTSRRFILTHLGYLGINTMTPNNFLTINGTMQIMANTTSTTVVCNSTNAGGIYYDGSINKHMGCNSTTWNALY